MELIDLRLPGFPDAPLSAALATDRGRVREHNEDAVGSYRPSPSTPDTPVDLALVVADGVGGHEGGQQASHFVVDAVHDTLAAHTRPLDGLGIWLDRLLQSIHQELLSQARARGEPSSMGSTATLAVIQGQWLWLAHVGDSRAYRLRNGILEQLTEDDSWVAEQVRAGALSSDDPTAEARKNVLTQCLGIGGSLTVEIVEDRLSPGDRFLLCSDGLHGLVTDNELQAALRRAETPETIAADLVDQANGRGGTDNISAVVFDVGAVPAYGAATPSTPAAAASVSVFEPEGAATASSTSRPAGSRRTGNWLAAAGLLLVVAATAPWMLGGNGSGSSDPLVAAPTSSEPAAEQVTPAASTAPVAVDSPTVTQVVPSDTIPAQTPTDSAGAPGDEPDTTTARAVEPDTSGADPNTDPDTAVTSRASGPDTTTVTPPFPTPAGANR